MKMDLWELKDTHLNPRARYGEYFIYNTLADIPQKYINTKIPYHYSYYFTTEKDMLEFFYELVGKDKEREREIREYLKKSQHIKENN